MPRWDELISASAHSLPYAFSWYLDAVAENWGGLVLNDYEAVMPLVWLRKLGIKCLYQPYYCQQLGVFAAGVVGADVYRDFLNTATRHFSYIHINLNPEARVVAEDFTLVKKKNLLLDLSPGHSVLQKEYSVSHNRNIAKARKAGLSFSEACDLKSFQKFYLENVNRTKENFKPQHEKIFKKLTQTLTTNKQGSLFTAIDEHQNLCAAILLISHKSRLIAIINTSSSSGKKHGASHFLFDQVIKKYSETELVLDFEGSSIATIARFYEGFGAIDETFYNYKNTLLKNIAQRFS